MFKYSTNMLLESAPIIGSNVSRTAIANESYFNTALESVEKIKSMHNAAKLDLYRGINEGASTDEFNKYFSKAYESVFPKKPEMPVSESCSSTEYFIKYFGDAIKILNVMKKNVEGLYAPMQNQAPAVAKESAKIISAVKEAKSNPTCPVCGKLPCTCNSNSEKLFKFAHNGEFAVRKIDFSNIGQSIFNGEDTKSAYDSVKTESSSLRSELCGLKDINISEAEFGDAITRSMRTVVRENVSINKAYIDYCTETVLGYESAIAGVQKEAENIASIMKEAADDVEKIMYSNSTHQLETDPMKRPLSEEETQELDLYCKAKVDEAINQCNTYLIAIGAKLDAIRSEYDQCKAVLAKYVCCQDQPIALPVPSDSPATPEDGVTTGQEPIAEKPAKESCDGDNDDDDDFDGDDIEDYNDNEDDDFDEYSSAKESLVFDRGGEYSSYAEAYEAFLLDTILKEAELTNYINATLMTEDTQLVLNEGLLASAKSGLQKVMQFLKKIWGKFTNSMSALFQNDQKYLADNKNIITGYKPKAVNIENWYTYDIKRIQEGKMGNINQSIYSFANASEMAGDMAGNSGIESKVKQFIDPNNGVANLFNFHFGSEYDSKSTNTVDKFKDYFRGTPSTVSAGNFSLQDMNGFYDYCYNFKSSTLNVITGEKDKINEIYQKAIDSLNALDNKVTDSAKEKKPDEQQQVNGSADIAAAMDMYFSEAPTITNTPSDTKAAEGENNTKSVVNNDQHSDRMKAATDADTKARDATAAKDGVTSETIKMLKTYYDNLFGLLRDYTTARITCAEGAYRDYMKLIRWHVGQYAGNAKGDDAKNGTNIDTAQAQADQQKQKNEAEADKI